VSPQYDARPRVGCRFQLFWSNCGHAIKFIASLIPFYSFVLSHFEILPCPRLTVVKRCLAKAAERLWEIGDIVNVLEAWEAAK
jgi:hypothetical protein